MSHRDIALVTGGAGFIGSHMVDLLLAEDFDVRVVDNLATGRLKNLAHLEAEPRVTFEQLDVRQLESIRPLFSDIKYVFHFAGLADIVPSIEHPSEYMAVNVLGTVEALEAARQAGVQKFVYAASSSCYGLATELPTSESAPITPEYPYALSKYQGELAAFHWGSTYGLPVVSVRIFNAYGPRSRTTGAYGAVFGVFLAQKLAGKPFTVVGDGTQTRDFVFVTDLARAFLAAAQRGSPGEAYNIASGAPQSVNRLVELLDGPIVHVPKRPGEPDCTWADISKATDDLEWLPRVAFEQGVAKMLERIGDWQEAPVWEADSVAKATRAWFDALSKKSPPS